MISALRMHFWEPKSDVAVKTLRVSDFLAEKNILFLPAAYAKP